MAQKSFSETAISFIIQKKTEDKKDPNLNTPNKPKPNGEID